MKLLFMLDELYAPGGPTLRFGRLLAQQAAALGHSVAVLQNVPAPKADYTDDDGVHHFEFCNTAEREVYDAVKAWRAAGLGAGGMLLRALLRPRLCWRAFCMFVLKRSPLEGAFRRQLKQCCQKWRCDAAVSVSAPHYTALALAASGLPLRKAAYMVDPFTAAATMRHVSSARRERALYQKLDVAFITDIMAQKGLYPIEFKDKTVALHFPAIRPPVVEPAEDDVALDGAYTNCVFVGNLYLDIRDPAFTLSLFEKLPQTTRLVLIGEGFGQFMPAFTEGWRQKLGPRLLVHPPVSQQAAFNAMQRADVLVSIGNSDASQLPSKVFDYISTGRPVLNLCKLEACPTRPFFEDYPLALNLLEAGEPTPQQAEQAARFIEQNLGKQVPFSEIEPKYRDYTPRVVAEKLLDALEAQLN